MDSGAATPSRPSPLRRTWATPRTSPSRARVSASSSGDARRGLDQADYRQLRPPAELVARRAEDRLQSGDIRQRRMDDAN
jgi:hypothetical protein